MDEDGENVVSCNPPTPQQPKILYARPIVDEVPRASEPEPPIERPSCPVLQQESPRQQRRPRRRPTIDETLKLQKQHNPSSTLQQFHIDAELVGRLQQRAQQLLLHHNSHAAAGDDDDDEKWVVTSPQRTIQASPIQPTAPRLLPPPLLASKTIHVSTGSARQVVSSSSSSSCIPSSCIPSSSVSSWKQKLFAQSSTTDIPLWKQKILEQRQQQQQEVAKSSPKVDILPPWKQQLMFRQRQRGQESSEEEPDESEKSRVDHDEMEEEKMEDDSTHSSSSSSSFSSDSSSNSSSSSSRLVEIVEDESLHHKSMHKVWETNQDLEESSQEISNESQDESDDKSHTNNDEARDISLEDFHDKSHASTTTNDDGEATPTKTSAPMETNVPDDIDSDISKGDDDKSNTGENDQNSESDHDDKSDSFQNEAKIDSETIPSTDFSPTTTLLDVAKEMEKDDDCAISDDDNDEQVKESKPCHEECGGPVGVESVDTICWNKAASLVVDEIDDDKLKSEMEALEWKPQDELANENDNESTREDPAPDNVHDPTQDDPNLAFEASFDDNPFARGNPEEDPSIIHLEQEGVNHGALEEDPFAVAAKDTDESESSGEASIQADLLQSPKKSPSRSYSESSSKLVMVETAISGMMSPKTPHRRRKARKFEKTRSPAARPSVQEWMNGSTASNRVDWEADEDGLCDALSTAESFDQPDFSVSSRDTEADMLKQPQPKAMLSTTSCFGEDDNDDDLVQVEDKMSSKDEAKRRRYRSKSRMRARSKSRSRSISKSRSSSVSKTRSASRSRPHRQSSRRPSTKRYSSASSGSSREQSIRQDRSHRRMERKDDKTISSRRSTSSTGYTEELTSLDTFFPPQENAFRDSSATWSPGGTTKLVPESASVEGSIASISLSEENKKHKKKYKKPKKEKEKRRKSRRKEQKCGEDASWDSFPDFAESMKGSFSSSFNTEQSSFQSSFQSSHAEQSFHTSVASMRSRTNTPCRPTPRRISKERTEISVPSECEIEAMFSPEKTPRTKIGHTSVTKTPVQSTARRTMSLQFGSSMTSLPEWDLESMASPTKTPPTNKASLSAVAPRRTLALHVSMSSLPAWDLESMASPKKTPPRKIKSLRRRSSVKVKKQQRRSRQRRASTQGITKAVTVDAFSEEVFQGFAPFE